MNAVGPLDERLPSRASLVQPEATAPPLKPRVQEMNDDLLTALKAAAGYMRNAKIDLETGCPKRTAVRTIEGGLKLVEAAIAKAEAAALTPR